MAEHELKMKVNMTKWTEIDRNETGKSSVSELQCQFQGMSPVIYAPQMKVIHAFGGTSPITEKVIYTFLYYYVIDKCRYI